MLRRSEESSRRKRPSRLGFGLGHGGLEHATQAMHAEHVVGECGDAGRVDSLGAVAPGEREQGVDVAHVRPRQWLAEQAPGHRADRGAELVGGLLQVLDVSHGIGSFVLGVVLRVDVATARRQLLANLHESPAVVESDQAAIGARVQGPPDQSRRQRVERALDLPEVVACDLRRRPLGHVVGLAGQGQQLGRLDVTEVLARHHRSARARAASRS